MRRMLCASLAICLLVMASPASATSETRGYRGHGFYADGDAHTPAVVCRGGIHDDVEQIPDGRDLIGACFGIPASVTTVDITVTDMTAGHVLALYTIDMPGITPDESGLFCDSISGVGVPAGALSMQVIPLRVLDTPPADCTAAGVPYKGSVTADFS